MMELTEAMIVDAIRAMGKGLPQNVSPLPLGEGQGVRAKSGISAPKSSGLQISKSTQPSP